MWIMIITGVPVALAFYGLARLQRIRSSHGAQGPCGAFTLENPALRRHASMLQSAVEREAEAYKYRVKWDSNEEDGQDFGLLSPLDVITANTSDVGKAKQVGKHKGKLTDVKWDEFEE